MVHRTKGSERPTVALVTGALSGIGAAIAARLLTSGFRVAGAGLAPDGRSAGSDELDLVIEVDLGTLEGCEQAVTATIDAFGSVGVLVNCAAMTGRLALSPFMEQTDAHLLDIVAVNLVAPMRLAKLVAPYMIDAGSGVIINVSSVAAFAAQWDATAYGATKSGLEGVTRGLALEFAQHGLRVAGVVPGPISTVTSADTARVSRSSERPYNRSAPLRDEGSVDDIAAAVEFLVSSDARFVTGTSLVVDGGFLAY